ncbi:MAG: hypothetical protein KKC79_08135 [Gammaproteobacteria bacterium]|nr:hypothetical protein [Gammaproteobacteria bacterium]MBU1441486.1 hypothetical protein [Gammaproteobacteria bacterium]MBU2288551.1 hypothetical protein [Gammaproteobacteria bacterium]MBU2408604.1 hypothetical protein [Gammaproteobacteria bacterium]
MGLGFGIASFIAARDRPQVQTTDWPRKPLPVDRALAANTSAIATAFNNFEQTRRDIDRRYLERLIESDRDAAELGSSTATLAQTLRLKAAGSLRGEDKTREYLHARLSPSIDAVRQRYLNELAAALTRFEIELEKCTVALAFDLAIELPRSDTTAVSMSASTTAETGTPGLGKLGVAAAFGALDASAISGIAGRMFMKQIGRLMAVPAIAMSDGLLPIGDLIAIAFAGWTAWDIYHLRSQYQRELLAQLTQGRSAFVRDVDAWVNQQAGAMRGRALAARDEISRKAMKENISTGRTNR